MQVKDIMTQKVVSVKPTTPVNEVARLLHDNNLSGLPVITDSGTAVGMITDKELFSADSKVYVPHYVQLLQDTELIAGRKQALPRAAEKIIHTTAADIMNQDIELVSPQADVIALAKRLATNSANPLLVGTDYNHIQGIVSRTDLIELVADQPLTAWHKSQTYYRPVDDDLFLAHEKLSTGFALVAKNKIDLWLTITTVLFIFGFIAGIAYVADPQILHLTNFIQ